GLGEGLEIAAAILEGDALREPSPCPLPEYRARGVRRPMLHHHGFLADYSRLDSPIHRLPVALKLAATVALVVAIVLVPMIHSFFSAGVLAALLIVAAISRVPPFFLLKRISMLEPLVIGAAMLSLFQPDGSHIFARIMVKSSLCLAATILLAN